MRRATWVVAALGLLVAGARPAAAGYQTYFDRSAFTTAAGGGLSLADFGTVPEKVGYQTLSSANQPSLPAGVTFSSTEGAPDDLAVIGPDVNPSITKPYLIANRNFAPLIARFDPNVSAVGADVLPYDDQVYTATVLVTLHDPTGVMTSFTVTPPAGSSEFFGIVGTDGTTIDEIRYTPPAGFFVGVSDFVFSASAPAAVPEPASLVLLGTASLSLAGYRGWRRRCIPALVTLRTCSGNRFPAVPRPGARPGAATCRHPLRLGQVAPPCANRFEERSCDVPT